MCVPTEFNSLSLSLSLSLLSLSLSQVASLSAELAVERQMGEETRKELAQARAGKVVPAFSLPPQNHLPTSSSYTQQPITWSEPTHTSNERFVHVTTLHSLRIFSHHVWLISEAHLLYNYN